MALSSGRLNSIDTNLQVCCPRWEPWTSPMQWWGSLWGYKGKWRVWSWEGAGTGTETPASKEKQRSCGDGPWPTPSLAEASSVQPHMSHKRLWVPESADLEREARLMGTSRGNDVRAVMSLPNLQAEKGCPELQLSENQSSEQGDTCPALPLPAMGSSLLCCVALCLLAAGPSLVKAWHLCSKPDSAWIHWGPSGSLLHSFSSPSSFPLRCSGFWSHPNTKTPD